MSLRKITILILAALAVIAASHLEILNTSAGVNDKPLTNVANVSSGDLGNFPSAADGIKVFTDRVKRNPRSAANLTILGQLYLKQAREIGDVANYQRAETALRQALELLPGYAPAEIALASALYAQHDFIQALDLARRVYQEDPRRTEALATMGDAYLALGQYQAAEETYQEMLKRQPGAPPALARLAHLAELQGKPDQAVRLMQQAAGQALAAGQSRQEMAWYLIRLGDLYFDQGRIKKAAQHYQAALRVDDNYYLALAGLGKVRAAEGRYKQAIYYYQQAVDRIPQPDFLAALGDLYAVNDQPDQAQLQYDTVEYIGELAEANQQLYNRQLANYYADHDVHLDEALHLALTELEYRQDIHGYDTAAWAYYKNGMVDQAQEMMGRAMQLGTRNARLHYHAGMIAQAQGRLVDAHRLLSEALAINPHFDLLQARIAWTTLEQVTANLN